MAQVIDIWDSGLPGAQWDVGLQWDVNVGPSPGDVEPYADLITSEHNQQPKFMDMVRSVLKPFADIQALLASFPILYDLDVATGSQLDVIGKWVGVSRQLTLPISGVYFSFDTAGVGFDEGTWFGPFNPDTGIVFLPDDAYRTLLRARIANNQWDGSIDGAYQAWDVLFAGTDFQILIQDYGDMHMAFAFLGQVPDALTLALITGGYLNLKPAGVKVDAYFTPTVPNAPYFGFDAQNDSIAGFDTGAWGRVSEAA